MVKDIANGAEGLGFDSRAGQIGHSVAYGSPSLRRFFGDVLSWHEMSPATCYTLRRNITKYNENFMFL